MNNNMPVWKMELIQRWERYLEINPNTPYVGRIKLTIKNLKRGD